MSIKIIKVFSGTTCAISDVYAAIYICDKMNIRKCRSVNNYSYIIVQFSLSMNNFKTIQSISYD